MVRPAGTWWARRNVPGIFQPNVFQPFVFQEDAQPLLGGIGHYLVEIEEAKRLAAITKRGPPGFVDLRSAPTFAPFGSPPIAPAAPPIDLQAVAAQRAAAQLQAAQATQKRRRDEEAILLLAS